MAERVECGDITEEMVVEVAERGVVAEAGFVELEEVIWFDGDGVLFEVGLEEGGELGELGLGGD